MPTEAERLYERAARRFEIVGYLCFGTAAVALVGWLYLVWQIARS